MSDAQDVALAETFAALARALLAEPTLDATLDKIVTAAADAIDGCQSAGISLIENRKITTRASSNDVPQQVDAIQYETDQGPCLDAIREHDVVRVDDLRAEDRWPQFAARAAAETNVSSMLAFRLFVEGDTLGALNLYSDRAHAFDHESQVVGSVFAAHAAVAMSSARQIEGLQAKLDSQGVIERAKGIIMASTGRSSDEAFDLLRQQSQSLNEKLRDVARGIVDAADR